MFTPKQIAALRYLIFRSKIENVAIKRILSCLIDNSDKLTKGVCLTLIEDREGYNANEIEAIIRDLSAMESATGTTHINEILYAMGSNLKFSTHYGDFDPTRVGDPFNNDGQFTGFDRTQVSRDDLIRQGMPLRYTIWFAKENYSPHAALVTINREQMEQIDIKKPGLYPSLEQDY